MSGFVFNVGNPVNMKESHGIFIGEDKNTAALAVEANTIDGFIRGVIANFPYARNNESSIREKGYGSYSSSFHTYNTWREAIDVMLKHPEQLAVVEEIPTDIVMPEV